MDDAFGKFAVLTPQSDVLTGFVRWKFAARLRQQSENGKRRRKSKTVDKGSSSLGYHAATPSQLAIKVARTVARFNEGEGDRFSINTLFLLSKIRTFI
jgi:hypothetical protein